VRYLRLDVGCDRHPRGDVNIDIAPYNLKGYFVRADAQYLPFKDKVFTSSTAIHVIEHLENQMHVMNEIHRVTNGTITIATPFLFSYRYRAIFRRDSIHKHWFLPSWFSRYGFKTSVRMKLLRPEIFKKLLPLPIPFFEIIAIKEEGCASSKCIM